MTASRTDSKKDSKRERIFIFVRHGESEANARRMISSANEGWPLTGRGREQAEEAAREARMGGTTGPTDAGATNADAPNAADTASNANNVATAIVGPNGQTPQCGGRGLDPSARASAPQAAKRATEAATAPAKAANNIQGGHQKDGCEGIEAPRRTDGI